MNGQCDIFLKEKATNYLLSLGMPASLQGFRYLREAIVEIVKNPKLKRGVTKSLYPLIADKFDCSVAIIERAMRHAIDVVCQRGNFYALNKMFDCNVCDSIFHPCITELVSLVAEKLSLDLNDFVVGNLND